MQSQLSFFVSIAPTNEHPRQVSPPRHYESVGAWAARRVALRPRVFPRNPLAPTRCSRSTSRRTPNAAHREMGQPSYPEY